MFLEDNAFDKRCFDLSLKTFKFIEKFPNKKIYWSLGDQLFRSMSSIGANIIEAKASCSRKEFAHFYQIALKSANETKYWLKLLKEIATSEADIINVFIKETDEIAKIIAKSIMTLKNK